MSPFQRGDPSLGKSVPRTTEWMPSAPMRISPRAGWQWLAPNLLPEAIGIDELVGADRHCIEAGEEAEIGELLYRMRERVDADAELADRVRLLEDLAVDPPRMQHQPGDQAADAAAYDDDFHDATPDTLLFLPRFAGQERI